MSAKKYSLINIILWRGLKERGSRKQLSSYSTSRVFTQSYLFILKHHHHILGFNSYSVTVVKLQVLEFHLVFPLPNWLFSTKVQFHWYFSTNPPILGSLSRERMLSAVQWFQYWGGVASIVGTLVMVQTLLHAAHIHIKTREFKTREPKGWFIQGGGGDVFTHLRRNWKWIEYKIKKYIGWKIASRYNATR